MHSRSRVDIAASALDIFSIEPRTEITRSGNISAISCVLYSDTDQCTTEIILISQPHMLSQMKKQLRKMNTM